MKCTLQTDKDSNIATAISAGKTVLTLNSWVAKNEIYSK